MSPAIDPVELTRALVRCESVTPAEGGALTLLQTTLEGLGFAVERLVFDGGGSYPVDNLFARIGSGAPHLCFAGHTDVVPAGDLAAWTHPPFAGEIADGTLYGRGAVDMKGNIACFVAALAQWLTLPGSRDRGSVSFLITGDEEADAVNGTVKVLEWMVQNGHRPNHCLVGEPSCSEAIGDTIRIGRRGSLSIDLTITGTQGHVGYAHKANNPVNGFVRVASALLAEPLDAGTAHFGPSNLEIVSVDVGNSVYNVIPARITAKINIRHNDLFTAASLAAWVKRHTETALAGSGLEHVLTFSQGAEVFVTKPGPLVAAATEVCRAVAGHTPELSTAGGTSDARFIKSYCEVIELGLVNKGIHAVDERVPLADLQALTKLYRTFLDRYFATFAD